MAIALAAVVALATGTPEDGDIAGGHVDVFLGVEFDFKANLHIAIAGDGQAIA